ncbi:MAG: transposase [Armatimonadetes bacterium]|nr:transposase [Armatimonadota bacterium]
MPDPSRPRLQRGWHCVYDMHYHLIFLIFTVKYRRALLDPPVVAELRRISREVEERYEFQNEFQIEALGADRNHVHLLCAAHPRVAAGQIARIYRHLQEPDGPRAVQGAARSAPGAVGRRVLEQQLLRGHGGPVRRPRERAPLRRGAGAAARGLQPLASLPGSGRSVKPRGLPRWSFTAG